MFAWLFDTKQTNKQKSVYDVKAEAEIRAHTHTHTHPQPHELEIDRKPNGMKKIPTFIKSDMKEKKSILSSKS